MMAAKTVAGVKRIGDGIVPIAGTIWAGAVLFVTALL
jgi:hypothetical protein